MEVQENKIIDEAVKSVGNLLKLAYNFAQATDVLMSSIALRLRRFGGMKREKKLAFGRFCRAVEDAAYWFDRAFEGDLEAATCGEWKKLDGYRQDANELIRAMMLYVDRTTTYKTYGEVMKYLTNMPEGGLFSADDIKMFDFKAKYREEMK